MHFVEIAKANLLECSIVLIISDKVSFRRSTTIVSMYFKHKIFTYYHRNLFLNEDKLNACLYCYILPQLLSNVGDRKLITTQKPSDLLEATAVYFSYFFLLYTSHFFQSK